jgi:hypothetical protein
MPLVQPVQQAIDERGFAGTHFPGKRDKAFARLNAIHQTRQRFLDLLRKEQKPGIRVDVERVFFQSEEALIHDL